MTALLTPDVDPHPNRGVAVLECGHSAQVTWWLNEPPTARCEMSGHDPGWRRVLALTLTHQGRMTPQLTALLRQQIYDGKPAKAPRRGILLPAAAVLANIADAREQARQTRAALAALDRLRGQYLAVRADNIERLRSVPTPWSVIASLWRTKEHQVKNWRRAKPALDEE